MVIRFQSLIANARQFHKLQSLLNRNQSDVPKGHLAVYVGEIQRKRYVVPISYLNHPSFQDLLHRAEEEFGFNHPMGGLTIPCSENTFVELTSRMYLNHPAFRDLLRQAEEEFGYDHPMGGLTFTCKEEAFISLTSRLRVS